MISTEVEPTGNMVFIENEDRPGVIGIGVELVK